MPRLFISYRRDDSRDITARIYDRMVQEYGEDAIFKDVDNIPPGADFREVVFQAVSRCEVVLVVIGRQWLSIKNQHGGRRLDDPDDFVRYEVEVALLRQDALIVPVLVDDAHMPTANDLPVSIRKLAFRNAIAVRPDPDFHPDMTRLIAKIKEQKPSTYSGRTLLLPKVRKQDVARRSRGWAFAGLAAVALIALSLLLILSSSSSDDDTQATQTAERGIALAATDDTQATQTAERGIALAATDDTRATQTAERSIVLATQTAERSIALATQTAERSIALAATDDARTADAQPTPTISGTLTADLPDIAGTESNQTAQAEIYSAETRTAADRQRSQTLEAAQAGIRATQTALAEREATLEAVETTFAQAALDRTRTAQAATETAVAIASATVTPSLTPTASATLTATPSLTITPQPVTDDPDVSTTPSPTPTASPTPTPEPVTAQVQTTRGRNINARIVPSTQVQFSDLARSNTRYAALANDGTGNWTLIDLNGQPRWVDRSSLDVIDGQLDALPVIEPLRVRPARTALLHVEANSASAVLAGIYSNTDYNAYARSSDSAWVLVLDPNGTLGWTPLTELTVLSGSVADQPVQAQIDVTPTPTVAPAEASATPTATADASNTQADAPDVAVQTTRGRNIFARRLPDATQEERTILPAGASYPALGTTDDTLWVLVEYQGRALWVSTDQVEATRGDLTDLPVIAPVTVRPEGTGRVHLAPDPDSARVDVVVSNSTYDAYGISSDGEWLLLQARDATGWVRLDGLAITAGSIATLPTTDYDALE